jgi:putative drug exporter of the RND superfamily
VAAFVAKAFAYLVVGLRFPLILAWAAAVVVAILFLPPLPSSGGGVADLIPAGSPAARADATAARLFGYPLEAGIAIVQRDPRDLPSAVVDKTAHTAVNYDRHPSIPGLIAVIPLPNGAGIPQAISVSLGNAAGLLTEVRQHTSTIVTYLEFSGDSTMAQQVSDADTYAHRYLTDVVGVTGPVAAEYEQGLIIERDLGWVELCTVLAIALIVGVRFRSLLAPLAALACAGTAYELAVRVVAWGALHTGIAIPQEADPVLVVLLLGVTTDYCVFFLAETRARLAEGADHLQAVRDATAASAPIVFAAGLIVAAGTGALLVARGGLLRDFGPGLAVTVLVAMIVSLTLMPALLGVLGRLMFRRVIPDKAPGQASPLARFGTSKPVAVLVIVACVAGLGSAAAAARGLGLGSPLIGEMPSSSDAVRASDAAAAGFAPGILAPTEILVIGPGAGAQTAADRRLADALRRQPGVASVVGPSALTGTALPASAPNPMIAKNGTAVRFALIYDSDPLNATAIGQVRGLTARLPALGEAAGLRGVRYEVGGQTALTGDAINATASDLWRVGLTIVLVTLLLLILFLDALLAPVYLLAASLLAVLATLGLTVLICDSIFGSPDLVYFVPFAAGVLLVSLGSDYNVFVVGRIWEEARTRTTRDAVAVAAPRASRAITTAGIALAASFGLLALIPLEQFRQLAIIMAAGVILDTVVVRSLLVPSLVALTGRAGMWPGHQRVKDDTARPGGQSERTLRKVAAKASGLPMPPNSPPTNPS